MDIYHNYFNYYQYKNNINKKNNFSFIIIFLLIILLIGLCVFLAPTAKNLNTFYYVELDKFQTYKQANNRLFYVILCYSLYTDVFFSHL